MKFENTLANFLLYPSYIIMILIHCSRLDNIPSLLVLLVCSFLLILGMIDLIRMRVILQKSKDFVNSEPLLIKKTADKEYISTILSSLFPTLIDIFAIMFSKEYTPLPSLFSILWVYILLSDGTLRYHNPFLILLGLRVYKGKPYSSYGGLIENKDYYCISFIDFNDTQEFKRRWVSDNVFLVGNKEKEK